MSSPPCDIFPDLLECAEAVECRDLIHSDSLLGQIHSFIHYQNTPLPKRMLVSYFCQALARRFYQLPPSHPSPDCSFSALYYFGYLAIAGITIRAIKSINRSSLHLIIFTDSSDTFWEIPLLLREVTAVKLTLIASEKLDERDITDGIEVKQFVANSGADIVKCMDEIRRTSDDETIVVCWWNKLHRLNAEPGGFEKAMSKVKTLKTELMIVVEIEANLNSDNFTHRFAQSFHFYSHLFEPSYITDLEVLGKIGREIENVVVGEGVERVYRYETLVKWRRRLCAAGFQLLPANLDNIDYLGRTTYDDGCALLFDDPNKDKPVAAVSAWRPMDENEVKDQIIQISNAWSKEGHSVYRFAVLAEIKEILEELCCELDLPLALTWFSYCNESNMKSETKRKICLHLAACYGCVDGILIDECSKYHLDEGQGIAGKALHMNTYYVPSFHKISDHYSFVEEYFYSSLDDRVYNAALAIGLKSKCFTNDRYLLEFFLTEDAKIKDKLINILKEKSKNWRFVSLLESDGLNLIRTNNLELETMEPQGTEQMKSTHKRKNESKIWDGFVKFHENGRTFAICNRCGNKYPAESKNGTSNILKHYNKCSKVDVEPNSSRSTILSKRKHSTDQDTSCLDIAKMKMKRADPLNTGLNSTQGEVHDGFFNIFDHLQGELHDAFLNIFDPPLDDVQDGFLNIYRAEKVKLHEYISNLSCRFSITIDLRPYGEEKAMYCCFILHFIDDGWELKQKILTFENLGPNVTVEALHEIIERVLKDWNISKNVLSIVVQINPSLDHMVHELKGMSTYVMPSYTQFLHLLIQEGLYEIKDYTNFLDSYKIAEIFSETWETTFLKLGNELWKAASGMQQNDCNFIEKVKQASQIYNCLTVFHDSMCTSPSIDGFIENICSIYKKLLGWEESEHSCVCSMATRMKLKFDEYWSGCSLTMGILVVVDPRFKLRWLNYSYEQIYGTNAESQLLTFNDRLRHTYNEYANGSAFQSPCGSLVRAANFKEWDKLKEKQKNELEQYLEQLCVNLEKDCDVLGWWRDNVDKFPLLSRVARDFLAIPMFSTVSKPSCIEEVMKMKPCFNDLNPEIRKALICAYDWGISKELIDQPIT